MVVDCMCSPRQCEVAARLCSLRTWFRRLHWQPAAAVADAPRRHSSSMTPSPPNVTALHCASVSLLLLRVAPVRRADSWNWAREAAPDATNDDETSHLQSSPTRTRKKVKRPLLYISPFVHLLVACSAEARRRDGTCSTRRLTGR